MIVVSVRLAYEESEDLGRLFGHLGRIRKMI